MARHSLCVESYLFSASLRKRNQYPVRFVVSLCSFYRKMHSTCLSYLSVSSVMCLIELGKHNSGWETSPSLNVFIAVEYSFFSGPNFFDWSFCSFIFNEAAYRANSKQNAIKRCIRQRGIWVLVCLSVLKVCLWRQSGWRQFRNILAVSRVLDSRLLRWRFDTS